MGKQRGRDVPTRPPSTAGEVSSGGLYTLAEFKGRTQLSDAAVRHAKRRGLKIHMVGRRGFVSGEEFIRFVIGRKGVSR